MKWGGDISDEFFVQWTSYCLRSFKFISFCPPLNYYIKALFGNIQIFSMVNNVDVRIMDFFSSFCGYELLLRRNNKEKYI